MDWSNERYVRVYTRDSGDLLAIGWEGRAVLWEMLRKCDRAGVVDEADPFVLAEMLRIPREVVEPALERLTQRGVIEVSDDGSLVIPNFIEAQEAAQSDRQRKAESRAKRRDRARAGALRKPVTDRDRTPPPVGAEAPVDSSWATDHDPSAVTERDNGVTKPDTPVTTRDDLSRRGHDSSHEVTPCCAVPSRAVQDQRDPDAVATGPLPGKPRKTKRELPEEAYRLADYLRRHLLRWKPDHAIGKGAHDDSSWPTSSRRRKWAETAEIMLRPADRRGDGRQLERTIDLVRWLFGANQQRDTPFAVEGMKALRTKWDRIDAAERKSRGGVATLAPRSVQDMFPGYEVSQ